MWARTCSVRNVSRFPSAVELIEDPSSDPEGNVLIMAVHSLYGLTVIACMTKIAATEIGSSHAKVATRTWLLSLSPTSTGL